jgi:hypothetical protein
MKASPPRMLWVAAIAALMLAAAIGAYAAGKGEGLRFVGKTAENGQECHQDVVVVVHGWLETGHDRWGQYCAEAIAERVDAGEWSCAYFEWSKGAITLNPRDAAVYARDVGGKRLAEELLKERKDLRHIHLIGHSSAAWLISEAAKILAEETNAEIHLTFLDAYVPLGWDESKLGDINAPGRIWADHYFTKDLTLGVTERKLSHARNVEVTELDPLLKDHNFPKYWYYGTVAGKYPGGHLLLAGQKVRSQADGIDYGFARSLEAGKDGWGISLAMKVGNKEAVLVRK